MNASARFSSRQVGLLCLLVTSVGWGWNWPAIKLLLMEWPPLTARGSSGLTAGLLVAALAWRAGQSLAVPAGQRLRLVAGAFVNVTAWMGGATLAMRWLTAGQGALLVYTMPAWATLAAWPLRGRRPGLAASAGLLLCLAGTSLLFGGQGLHLGLAAAPGIAFAVGAALIFGIGTVALTAPAMPPLAMVAWQLGLGSAPLLVWGLVFEDARVAMLDGIGWGVMAYMTLVPMALCYLTWFAALRRLPPATASIATLLTPVIGVTASAFVLGEPLGMRQFGAMALTLAGIALALRVGGASANRATPDPS